MVWRLLGAHHDTAAIMEDTHRGRKHLIPHSISRAPTILMLLVAIIFVFATHSTVVCGRHFSQSVEDLSTYPESTSDVMAIEGDIS